MSKTLQKIKNLSDEYLVGLLDEIDTTVENGFSAPGSEMTNLTRELAAEFNLTVSSMIETMRYLIVKEMADRFRKLITENNKQ